MGKPKPSEKGQLYERISTGDLLLASESRSTGDVLCYVFEQGAHPRWQRIPLADLKAI